MWSGGSYTKGNAATGGWTGDASLGIGIEAGRHDTQDNDFATGINQCLNKDGSNAATGNLNVGGFKVTNVANATASSDVVTLGQAKAGIPVQSASPNAPGISSENYDSGSTGPRFHFVKSRGGTINTNTIVQNGDEVGGIFWYGAAGGTSYNVCAQISANIDGTPGATNDMPGRLSFLTTSDGSGGGTERMRINNSGEILIGKTTSHGSNYKLQVGDATATKFISVAGGNSGADEGSAVGFFNGATPIGAVGNYSAIQGGAYNGGFTLKNQAANYYVLGLTAAAGTHFMKWDNLSGVWSYDTSSARYKENIVDSNYGLAEILAMRPVTFTYKAEPSRHDVGFIAEEMVDVVPEVVAKDIDGNPDAISYDRLTSVLCKAIQELEARVAALEEA